MPTITVDDALWTRLSRAAQRADREPGALATEALREYLERAEDVQLLDESVREAGGSAFDIEDTEALIRDYRAQRSRAA